MEIIGMEITLKTPLRHLTCTISKVQFLLLIFKPAPLWVFPSHFTNSQTQILLSTFHTHHLPPPKPIWAIGKSHCFNIQIGPLFFIFTIAFQVQAAWTMMVSGSNRNPPPNLILTNGEFLFYIRWNPDCWHWFGSWRAPGLRFLWRY